MNPEDLVPQIKAELESMDSVELHEHAERYEALAEKLSQALSSIEGM